MADKTLFAGAVYAAAALSLSAVEVKISFPPAGCTLAAGDQTFVAGQIKPAGSPLSINGIAVTPYRTGSFVCMLRISEGKNVLEIRSGSYRKEHFFFLKKPKAPPPPPPAIKVIFPAEPSGVMTGSTFQIACDAPVASPPVVRIGARDYTLKQDPVNAGHWSLPLRFYCPLDRLPVTFSAPGLPSKTAGPLSALASPQTFKVTGELFSTRAYSECGSGEIVFFPVQGDIITSDGFIGPYRRLQVNGTTCYLHTDHLKPVTLPPGIAPNPKPADIARGFGPHPPVRKSRDRTLIVIDAGHGGDESGAIGPSGLEEKVVTLMQARVIERSLKSAGYRTMLTRSRDHAVGLYDRVRAGYRKKADAFISVHYNSCPSQHDPRDRRHISTYAWNDIGRQLALPVHTELAKISPARNAGVLQGSLAVCRNPAVPSILLELDFITSPEGEELIQSADFQKRVAEAVLKGVEAWCGR